MQMCLVAIPFARYGFALGWHAEEPVIAHERTAFSWHRIAKDLLGIYNQMLRAG